MRIVDASLVLALAAGGCSQAELHEIDLGVDAHLYGVASRVPLNSEFIAVGAGGLIVDERGNTWTIGDADLRAVAWDRTHERWWVVGDAGTVAVADDRDDGELEWIRLDPGTDADLHDIALWEDESEQVVIVGDDTLLIGTAIMPFNYLWTEPTPPTDGWGRLRDVEFLATGVGLDHVAHSDAPTLWAVGERGRMLSAYKAIDNWTVEDLGVDVHLTCASAHWAAGADGTFVSRRSWLDPWAVVRADPPADLIDCSSTFIADDRRIYELDELARGGPRLVPLIELDWQPRGFDQFGDLVVGDDGHVGRWWPYWAP